MSGGPDEMEKQWKPFHWLCLKNRGSLCRRNANSKDRDGLVKCFSVDIVFHFSVHRRRGIEVDKSRHDASPSCKERAEKHKLLL